MDKWIKHISGTIPYTNKTVDIELDGKNLIVTGANGAGKTSFVRAAHEKVNLLIVKKTSTGMQDLYRDLDDWRNNLNRQTKGTISYDNVNGIIKDIESKIREIEEGLCVSIPDNITFSSIYDDRKAIIHFFEEKRLADIAKPVGMQGLAIEKEDAKRNFNRKLSNRLEQHLVNLKTRASLAITEEKNDVLADKINNWIDNFENTLKILFEDNSVKLLFNYELGKTGFTILQNEKPPYTFQSLSAGYRAIFDIYADLLMRTEYFDVLPNELTGVVFIDEIDSHLHVSLQRLILPFFTQSFPKIQFIVTTHSPFVLMSTPDTVVYDLAKNEPITEDLSYYTYSAVMEGLWDVKPIAAWVEQKIKDIEKIINSENKDIQQLRQLMDEIKGREGGLDSESKAIFLLGKQTLLKEERKNV